MSNTGPVKNHPDAYDDLLSDIYEEISGDTKTFPPIKEAFRDYIGSSQSDSFLHLISMAAVNERISGMMIGYAFRKFLAGGARCHPESVLYRLRREVEKIESLDEPADRYRMWRAFIDKYIEAVEDVSFHVSMAPKHGGVSLSLQRKIISAGRRSQFYANEIENAFNNYFERLVGESSDPETEILLAQFAAAHKLNEYVLNVVNTIPSLHLLRIRTSIDENRLHRMILQKEWIRFNDPFNWIRRVYLAHINTRNIGVTLSISGQPPNIEPANPQLVRHIIDRIVLLAVYTAKMAGPHEIFFSWDETARELHIEAGKLKDLTGSASWKEVKALVGRLRTRWGVNLDGNGHKTPHIFIEIPLIEDPPIPQGKGGMPDGRGGENIPIGEIQRGSSILNPALLGAGLYNGSVNMPSIMPFQPQIMANTSASTLFTH